MKQGKIVVQSLRAGMRSLSGLSDRSKTLYLQMMDAKDSVVWREKYPIENGLRTVTCHG